MRDIVAPMYDQGYSALIEDLAQRGMLDNTHGLQPRRVRPHAEGEPGRRPRPLAAVLDRAASPAAACKGGRVVGKSDEIGGYPAERPVAPGEVVATIYHSLGIDLDTELPGPQGRPIPSSTSARKRSRSCSRKSSYLARMNAHDPDPFC